MWKVGYCFLIPHWSIFGHTRQSSEIGMSFDIALTKPEQCAHFAGDSKTFPYSIGLMSTTLSPSTEMLSFDMQWGHAQNVCLGRWIGLSGSRVVQTASAHCLVPKLVLNDHNSYFLV